MSSRNDRTAPQTVGAYALATMRNGILTGHYPLGSKLDQQLLAAELGTSVVPIRESLRQLEAEGLIKLFPHRGAFVIEASVEELKEIYVVRTTLEELATQLAVPNISTTILQRLSELLEQMGKFIAGQEFDDLLRLNRAFHFTIYEASKQQLLREIVSTLWDRSMIYQRLYTYSPERADQTHREHEEILRACQAGDRAKAGQAVRHNLETTVEFMLSNSDQLLNTE